ncbi:MAG: PAS domain S-box protein, partial [Rhodoferax sp.]
MTDPRPGLHRRAEAALHQRAARSGGQLDALSGEAAQHLLHELQVHQIELEMQNEELRRTQAELDSSQARYFDFYDFAPVSYCTLDESGLILQSNLGTGALLSVERNRLPGQALARFILPADQDAYRLLRKRMLQIGEPQTCELRMVKPDGERFWVHLQGIAVTNEAGLRQSRVVLSDISERKKAEAELLDSEQRYRTLVEWTPEAFLVHRAARIIYANPAATRLFGVNSADDLIGTSVHDWVHPDDRQFVLQRQQAYGDDGADSPMRVQKMTRRDGTTIQVAVQGTSISYDGEPARQSSMRDVTELKKTETALRDSEHRYRTLADWTPEAILIHRTGSILYANPSAVRVFGAGSASELVGKAVLDRVHPDSREIVLARFSTFAEHGGDSPMIEEKLIRLDRTVFVAEVQGTVIEYDGAPALHASIRDISARKAVEAALEAARL